MAYQTGNTYPRKRPYIRDVSLQVLPQDPFPTRLSPLLSFPSQRPRQSSHDDPCLPLNPPVPQSRPEGVSSYRTSHSECLRSRKSFPGGRTRGDVRSLPSLGKETVHVRVSVFDPEPETPTDHHQDVARGRCPVTTTQEGRGVPKDLSTLEQRCFRPTVKVGGD